MATNTAWQQLFTSAAYDPDADTVSFTPPRRSRVSGWALLTLVLGVLSLAVTFTGLLASVGFVLGVLTVLVAVPGLVRAGGRGRTGRGVATLGLLCGLAAGTLAVLAVGGHLSWLSPHVDEIRRVRDWLDVQLPWFRRW